MYFEMRRPFSGRCGVARGGNAVPGPGADDAILNGIGVLGALPGAAAGVLGIATSRSPPISTWPARGGWNNGYPSDGSLSPFFPSYPSPRPSSYSPTEYVVQTQSPSAVHPNENKPITTDSPSPVRSAACKKEGDVPFLLLPSFSRYLLGCFTGAGAPGRKAG